MSLLIVYTTCATADEADKIATAVVTEKLAACTNQGAEITSCYFWEGRLEKSKEIPLLIKTVPEKFEALSQCIKALHSYTTPMIVAWRADNVDPDYMLWAKSSVGISS